MRKKILLVLALSIIVTFTLSACTANENKQSAPLEKKLELFSTINPTKGILVGRLANLWEENSAYVVISNDGPFNAESVGFTIYRKDEKGKEKVGEKSIEVTPEQTIAVTSLSISKEGDYVLKVFAGNEENVLFSREIKVLEKNKSKKENDDKK